MVSLIGWPFLDAFYRQAGSYLVVALVFTAAAWAGRRAAARPVDAFGFVMSLFLVLTPGFGIQYLVWVLPWIVTLGTELLWVHSIAASVFMLHVYTKWSGGFPWYLADSTYGVSWSGFLVWHELLCWLVALVVLKAFADLVMRPPPEARP